MNQPVFIPALEEHQFFAPMSSDVVDGLIGQYSTARKRISALAEAVSADAVSGVLHYFIEGNLRDERHGLPHKIAELFNVDGAIAQLNADYWGRALLLTDVMDYMPQKRREEWSEQIRNPQGKKKHRSGWGKEETEWEVQPLPEFEENSVRSTLGHLLASRAKFLAERVDGIFRSLSRQHVTNQPQGFSKRMIIQYVFSYGTAGHIDDLRCVIAKFMGRDEPKHGASSHAIKAAQRHNGQWMLLDGGALRLRVYGGAQTAHLEVHPEMAWRLNAILASLHPMAIPAEFREKPKRAKKIKDFVLFDKPLPFAVIGQLAAMGQGWKRAKDDWRGGREYLKNTLCFGYTGDVDKATRKQAEDVLSAIGGVFVPNDKSEGGACEHWAFDYDPSEVIDQVVCSGCIPDHKSHQFYPTPAAVAEKAIGLANIGPEHACLEPSAGQGGLADLMTGGKRLVCIEISQLHCEILKAKGHYVERADFLKWDITGKYDRIVMNPPFSEGRWQAHLEHASRMLAKDGCLVAILPASAKGKKLLEGLEHEYSQVFSNEFSGTSVSVVILKAYHA